MTTRQDQTQLKLNSLFQKVNIRTKSSLREERIQKFGDKIIIDIPLNDIILRDQIRKDISQETIKNLANDINQKGLINPVLVMKHQDKPNKFYLLLGEHRFRAFKFLSRTTIPCIVRDFFEDENKLKLLQLAENMHRVDVHPVEIADTLLSVKKNTGYTLEKIAKLVGRRLDTIKQYSRIYNLSLELKNHYRVNKFTKNQILKDIAKRNNNTLPLPMKETFVKIPETIIYQDEDIETKQKKLKDLKKQIAYIEKYISN